MDSHNTGSQWDIMMNVLVDSGKYINTKSYKFKSEISTIEYLNKNTDLRNYLCQWLSNVNGERIRSKELSMQYRQKGNQLLKISPPQYDVAADCYTKAIFSAPINSIELSYAHANRAVCYSSMPEFRTEGYWDCEVALKLDYPMNKRDKLLDRKFALSANSDDMRQTIKEIQDLIKANQFTDEHLKLRLKKEECQKREQFEKTEKASANEDDIIVAKDHKKLIEKSDATVGRYILAGESIKKNEAICSEKAFSFVPVYNDYEPDAIPYHCQNCAKTNCVPFRCYDCARASYCNPSCAEQHRHIHKLECAGYRKNLWMKIGIAQLSFRSLIVGFSELRIMFDQLTESNPKDILSALLENKDPSFTYGEMLRLVTNFDKMDVSDTLRYALTAQLLAVYLDEYTDFFTSLSEKCIQTMPIDDWKKLTAAILMKHMGQLVSNGHAISDIELMPPSLFDFSYRNAGKVTINEIHLVTESSRIFTAIFPRISLLNHSCDPNIRNTFNGSHLTIYAARDINVTAEIFNCYGPNYKLMPKSERKEALKRQYCFDCKCEKCSNDDKTFDKYQEYICPNDRCRSTISIDLPDRQWWHDTYDERHMNKFQCNKCHKPLPLNPKTLREFFEGANTTNDMKIMFSRRKTITEELTGFYMTATKCLGKYHDLKAIMAPYLLKYRMQDDVKLFPDLAYVAMDNYCIARERFGQFSLETIIAITYALNILKMAKGLDRNQEYQQEVARVRKVLDIKKIEKSISILSKPMQILFKKAMEEI